MADISSWANIRSTVKSIIAHNHFLPQGPYDLCWCFKMFFSFFIMFFYFLYVGWRCLFFGRKEACHRITRSDEICKILAGNAAFWTWRIMSCEFYRRLHVCSLGIHLSAFSLWEPPLFHRVHYRNLEEKAAVQPTAIQGTAGSLCKSMRGLPED